MKFFTIIFFTVVSLAVIHARRMKKQKQKDKCLEIPCDLTKSDDLFCFEDEKGELSMYVHRCMFEILKCRNPHKTYTIVDMERCRKENELKQCDNGCPVTIDPRCVEDSLGEIEYYQNKCFLDVSKCRNPTKEYKIVPLNNCYVQKPPTDDYRLGYNYGGNSPYEY